MTQDMTETIMSEKDIDCEIAQGNCPCVESKKSGISHALAILFEYGWSMARVWLEYGYTMATRLRYAMMLVLLMAVGIGDAWAQQDLSGVYYIASDNTAKGHTGVTYSNATDDSEKFYLVPAANPVAEDNTFSGAYYSPNYNSENGDPEKPFLTTYYTNKDNNSVWIVKKTGDYYHVIHAITGKYVIYEVPLPNVPNSNNNADETKNGKRKTMHLQMPDNEAYSLSSNENFKFTITRDDNTIYRLVPKNRSGWYWNPANCNQTSYSGLLSGTDHLYQMGLVGVYNGQNDGGSKWHFETALLTAPTITCTNGVVTVSDNNSLPAGYNIRYTIDGTTPTASSTILPVGGYTVIDPCTFKAVIERYGIVLTQVASEDLEPLVRRASFNLNADGSITISIPDGTTVYYTTDGTEPSTSNGTVYTGPISASDVANATTFKAIAVDNASNTSAIATQALANYTYHIVNKAKAVAIQHTVKQAVGKPLGGYTDIPADIRSPYLNGEEIKFYNNADCADEHQVTATPATTDIYVSYTTDHLMQKFIHLRGVRPLNVTVNGDYIYDNSGAFAHKASPTDDEKASSPYLWYFSGEDPYAIEIRNAQTNNYLGYTTPSTLSLAASPANFILMAGSTPGDNSTYEQLELMAATGDGNYYRVGRTGDAFSISTTATGHASLQIRTYPNSAAVNYYLIDKSGKILTTVSNNSEAVSLPDQWKSPLVSTYHYWKASAFTIDGNVYTLKESPAESDRINNITDATDGNIYVTYDVSNEVIFDTTDDGTTGATYRLQFFNGETFNQENGKDGREATATKGVYPYFNGDAMLFVYGADQWTKQLNSGASTRSRWLWYVVSPTSDPYHVKIMTYQANSKPIDESHGYFRTFPVSYRDRQTSTDVTRVVTTLTTKENVASAPPTEYMVLTGQGGQCKLVTKDPINDGTTNVRRTVNSFEQYWKNYPTIQNLLGGYKVNEKETYTDNIILTAEQEGHLPANWHTYQIFANSAPWVEWITDNTGTSKQYQNKNHWFQTVSMSTADGSDGEFRFIATTLDPQVILIDNHGWEVMRKPMYDEHGNVNAKLKLFDSPMVQTYHWYPTSKKIDGYHKYTVADGDEQITIYQQNAAGKWVDSGDKITHTSTTLFDIPYNHITPAQDKSVMTDFYVTYDVKPEYDRLYTGAATEEDTRASAFLVKQGDKYAKINSSNQPEAVEVNLSQLEDVTTDLQWYVKPNFDIDAEMGYDYEGENGEKNKAVTDTDNFDEGRNGFDPYNVQIQSVHNPFYFFKTSTTGSHLNNGIWEGTSTNVDLKNMSSDRQTHIEGYDQTDLTITNATFMVVDDGNGHMLLMPRFDQTKVVNSFEAPRLSDAGAATQYLELTLTPTIVHSSSELSALSGQYTLASDFVFEGDFESLGTSENPFTGTIDGGLHPLSGLSTPLIAYADGAIIKNIILDNVSISGGTNAGAIAANAKGETRIFNCGINSGSVGGSGDVGGIVGSLEGSARVINCYSYATITGGLNVGGIVGNNKGTTTAANITTMVMNCAFYGDITGGSTVSPVYGGTNINNLNGGLNTFNYYAYDKLKSKAVSTYNCALGVQDVFWNRFEQYRQLLNSNKKLAAKYASSTSTTVKAEDMKKWVLETADRTIATPKPYPVLKAQGYYPSIINYDTRDLANYSEENRNKGLKTGTLAVTISGVGSNAPDGATITNGNLTLTRTDKDFDRFNFNYDKVQLPYYNEVGIKNYTGNKVVTGWKITSMAGGTTGSYTTGDNFGGYNFADRNCTAKDIYDTSGRVFSQGAYFDVPYGVTGITIEPYWGEAVYVADRYLDVVYNAGYGRQDVSQLPETYGADGVEVSINGSTQKVWHTIDTAVDKLSTGGTVYDHAVVLVGNVHLEGNPPTVDKSFTVMSADLDFDNEPDYSFIFGHNNRQAVSPIRFDFINMPGIAMAQKPNGATSFRNVSIFKPKGWFETTNTCIARFVQFECDNGNKSAAPVILLGGMIDQFVSTQKNFSGKTTYLHIGGNAWFKDFGNGTHSDGTAFTPHIPISVTGGDFDGFYLSGTYQPDATVRADNAECYISGGRFKEAAGAAQQQINGNVQWQIYNADIDNFYGGGVNAGKPVTGDITVDIINSHVGTYCGGPKFGNMQSDKTVTTNATGSTFDYYFGAGYGGISYNRVRTRDISTNVDFASWQNDYTGKRGKYYSDNRGIASDFDYEFFVWSTGVTGGRFYVKYSSLSTAQTNNVKSTLTNCIVNRDFYGGGSLGNVVGTATSTLDGCIVEGNVFGGGYSASQPKVPVRTGGFKSNKAPKIDTNAGVFDMGEMTDTEDFTLVYGTLTNNASAIDNNAKTIITDVDLTTLGQVTNTDLTITGNTTVKGQIFDAEGNVTETTGGVYGGGDMSAVNGNTKIDIQNTDATGGVLNVFGGGNTADVIGNSQVDMTGGKVIQSVYGGGKGQTTIVGGNVIVNMGAKAGEAPSITYSGTGVVQGDVYGGSALGKVNTTADKTTTVNVFAGTVNGSVFGGGLGQLEVAADPGNSIEAKDAIVAENQGNTTINVEGGTVRTAVYGGANVNGVLQKDATVTITGGTIGDSGAPNSDIVFGGGKGEPTLVNGNVTVNVGTQGQDITTGATIYGHVYGGSALGNTNASKTGSDPMEFNADKTTHVNLYAGTINGYAFGGGLGRKAEDAVAAVGNPGDPGYVPAKDAVTAVKSFVGGDVNVLLEGAKVQQIFGCNNLNGTPKGHVKVHVKRTNSFSGNNDYKNNSATALNDRTTYDVTAVYGGGNQADYNPTKATGTEKDKKEAFAEVEIEGCDQTSIEYVYGGGNAAAVPADSITVKSAYIIGQLFGGGNGAGDGNPGADVGVIDKTAYEANHENGIYGTGLAKTVLIGGQIRYVYGGSNTKGNVRGGTSLKRNEANSCTLKIHEIYGAGQVAPMDGDVNITLECMPEEFVSQVFGGAKNATINGNVSLTVTSGKFGRVFGGNNEGGSINGSITVNVYEHGCLPLIIGELYGGGFNAPYSIYGCTQNGNDWTANTSGDLHFDQEAQERSAVEVNVYSCTSIGRVFGGGFGSTAHVVGNTHVYINMMKGIVNDVTQDNIGKIGQVFGGGNQGIVKGSTLIDIGTALANEPNGVKIESGDDYLSATSNTTTSITAGVYGGGNEADVEGNATLNIGTQNLPLRVNIASNIFGGGLGENTHVTGDVVMNIGKRTITNQEGPVYAYDGYAKITGDVYGGSAKGKVNSHLVESVETASEGKTTQVNFYGGTISGNLYGGGLGEDNEGTENDHAADVYGPVTVTVEGGYVTNVFGCNNVLGSPKSTATVNIHGTPTPEAPATYIIQNVYGGGNMAAYTGTGGVSVAMTNGFVNDVFGGGLGTTATVNGTTTVGISGGKVTNDVYGGGSQGSVTGAVNVTLNGGTIAQNIYGGGLGDRASLGEGHADVAANVDGAVTVSVISGSATNVFGCNNVNGMPTSTVDVVIGTKTGEAPNITYSGTGVISGNVYGGGNMAACSSTPTVKIYGGTVNNNVYGGGLGSTAGTGGSAVIMEGGLVKNDVYGGGSEADVTGSVNVRISGGTVTHDVYGGGALANTNTDNWDTNHLATTYTEIAHTTANQTPVTGFYTKDGDVYTEVTAADATAVAETKYYTKTETAWAEGKNSNSNTTTVTLTGGTIGNVYGGGLGSESTAVYVYGDITVNVNKASDITAYGGTGATFTRELVTNIEVAGKNYPTIPTTGNIFGANNFNGTPKGNVTVEVFSTKRIDGNSHILGEYEIQGVYGGGNMANYSPAADKVTKVIIHGCDKTSIEKVYGGGNSASVPSTDVTIYGAFDIGYAFAGGNGSKPIKNSAGTWVANGGAIITGDAKIFAKGGRLGQVFGGSDAKGDVLGAATTDTSTGGGECDLTLTRLFGAGNEADVSGDVNMILSGCNTSDAIQFVHGGSYNAHITGNVNLTITSGVYTNVFGGNDARGSIGGNITVNIEETDACKPIIIQNLVGGGNEAPFPGTMRNGTEIDPSGKKITVNIKSATRIDNIYGGGYKADVKGDTEVNINMRKGSQAGQSYTVPSSYTGLTVPNIHNNTIDDAIGTIGNIYGGGNEGNVIGNSVVNIGTETEIDILKREGDVAGGKLIDESGNDVYDSEGHIIKDDETPRSVAYVKKSVLGAHITGDVFGGGKSAYVTGNTTVNFATAIFEGVSVDKGSIFGGGSMGDVLGNTNVTMSGGYVFNGIFGGGLSGSVGTFTRSTEAEHVNIFGHTAHAGCIGKPILCAENTGKCTIVVNGGQIGPVEVATQGMTRPANQGGPVIEGWIWGGGQGLVEDPADNPDTHFTAYVGSTDVTIGGTALIMESIIGGGEFGRVLGNTLVKIQGGQIGIGEAMVDNNNQPIRYTDDQFVNPLNTTIDAGNALTECSHFPYGKVIEGKKEYLPYDPYYEEYPAYIAAHPEFGHASTSNPSDGKTWIGCVFGGGSGYMPYKKKDGSGYDWCRSAGLVEGNTEVRISGGHILTNVYGANEITDVMGQSIIKMTGGTIGVPRTQAQIAEHPLTCYLFGGGKGDERPRFFDFNDVDSVDIDISGGIIYGSVFGGSEDGHVLGNINLTIRKGADFTIGSTTYTNGPIIGTWGTTYVEGNVFGGGRGFSGETLTAGSTGGNVTMSIEGGTMRGSVYGGGRLASVGIGLNPPEHLYYGQLKDETGGNSDPTYGHVTINISGGTIGNGTTEAGAGHPVSGNVFGGSMGRITMLDGKTRIPLWPKQAVTKLSNVTISGGEIWNSVYGGGEIGIVRNHATVNVSGGTIHGNVFGGGYGSDEQDKKTISAGGYDDIPTVYYTFTPMIWTGCVSGDTEVNISGGKIDKNVYGGGNFASVGLMNYNSSEDGTTYNYITKHDTKNGFGLSWPYEFQYIKAAPTDGAPGGNAIGGKTTVNITGGRIGTTANAGYGNVFGGSKGMVTFKKEDNETLITDVNEQRYAEAFCANVRETAVNIKYTAETPSSDDGSTTQCIVGAVYGGAQDGHVYEDANVTITNGLIGLSVYGGGQGESTFQGKLKNQSTGVWKDTTEPVHSITAGKVYGNTSVSMTGGTVIGHVYGGGNLASVGKGNYAGGADDYYPAGYGEKLTGNLWDNVSNNSKAFLGSGNATVTITGGKVGTPGGTSGSVYGTTDATPTGLVFGGSRGRASEDIMLDPRHEYAPDFYLGYVNNTSVTIGSADGAPNIYSQVFGGGRDGHVRNNAHVVVNNGFIGQPYNDFGSTETDDYQRYHRGNVYGAGSGLGVYDGTHHGISSGSVTNSTTVDINGGTIYNNVYGGGALACVGPPRLDPEKDYATASISKCTVNINGGTIGEVDVYNNHKFGGTIYGGSRGDRGGNYNDLASGETIENYASVLWTEVNINPHPTNRNNDAVIAGNVYGGARGGQVKKDTKVNLLGGVIKHNAYGGGRGTTDIAADVLGNTTVELNKGVASTAKGCIVDKVFGCNDLNGTPKGHVLVHVYGTQNSGKDDMSTKVGPPSYTAAKGAEEEYKVWLRRLISEATASGGLAAEASQITNAELLLTSLSGTEEASLTEANKTDITNRANDIVTALKAMHNYDVTAVYGGGDLAPYVPTVAEDNTEVIIEGCDVTSIKQVYGGGNAAFAPATNVLVKSAYIIDELFGGGNGLDNYVKDGSWYENPGANVGYKQLAYYDTGGSHGTGEDDANKYAAITYPDAVTKEDRIANYSIGLGTASTVVNGGHIHHVYGGSNEKGNIRAEALLQIEQAGSCTLITDEVYAGSKTASIDAETNTVLDCVREGGTIYGGSYNADILNDVHIRITNGHYAKVFGGNNQAGTITGSITIDVEEHGCTPIVIDELYAGGYLAPYSVYGYSATTREVKDENGNVITGVTQRIPYKKGDAGALATPSRDPQINIISATKIGKIYGGGYQADLIGSPHINVNMTRGIITEKYASEYPGSYTYITETDAEGNKIIPVGTIGTIFGGGNKGDIYGDTYVEIGTGKHHTFTGEEETITPARNAAYIMRESTGGQVFGGGDQGYVYGNTNVIIGNGYIYDRVYGGGNDGTVGTVSTRAALPAGHASHANCLGGKPTAFAENTGRTTVTVSGGYVGPYNYERSTGVATPTSMHMPDDYGYVFGAGRGRMANPHIPGNEDIEFMTYVDSTRVTISGSALIAGGVYGGSENGRVLRNTGVYIEGGQIGLGAGLTTAYAESDFIDPTTATAEQITTKANAMPECAHWAYGIDTNDDGKKDTWLPYDEHADNVNYQRETYGAASTTGYDGHTFYGNVFGGGSGYFAYETETAGVYEWLPSAGLVEGDTYVNISGGHILTNVYGGNEMTNITGTAHVTMTGGTLGVPRTLTQIADHPVTCYLFGGGKGDQRVHFNKSTNVGHAKVNVSGGIIYGSVFGGGEDGHVLGNVDMNISDGAKIGTWGTSYVDGNVFGGGRGFGGDAYTAGNVAGAVTLNISGGTMLGSVYGGGRLGSVGYGLFSKDEEGYGTMRADNITEDGFVPPGGLTKGRGHVVVNISGDNTVIGNKYEYQYISPETTGAALATAKTYLPSTQFESNNRLKHTRGGNVFAGGMGRYTQLDGTTPISTYDGSGNLTSPIEWKKLGNVKSTKLTISGNPWIMGNVYGGGEYGAVQGYHQRYNGGEPMVDAEDKPIVASTEILFSGGTIGTEITTAAPAKETVETTAARSIVQYTFGSIYGGGMGQETHDPTDNHGGDVKDSTYVSISGENTLVRASVFGGGEMAIVDGNTNVNISGGEIGRNEVKPADADDDDAGYVLFGSATMGNVYGGGKGVLEHTKAGLVKGNTNVNISGGSVYHNVYGGGALASVGTFDLSNGTAPAYIPIAGVPYNWTDNTGTATVTITGGTIGISGRDNGLVFGSSRGDLSKPTGTPATDPYDRVAWVNKSVVTIGTNGSGTTLNTPLVKGSVYGGGENGHNDQSATVNVYSGTIGVTDTEDPWYYFTDKTLEKSVQLLRGNVYGAGSGTDTYTGDDSQQHYNPKSGMVGGNTIVNIAGGHVGRSVYGGGAMASVGTITSEVKHESIDNGFGLSWPYKFTFAANTGKATVNVTGGHIGTRQLEGGDVYGSSRGEAGDRYDMSHLAFTNETEVNVNYPTTIDMPTVADIQNDFSKQCITGSVHGSGENGYVYGDTKVTLSNGLIGHSLYGAGKGNGTYTKALSKIGGGGTYDAKIYSLIAGKVMGNTSVTMNGGRVGRNVYGGGNMGSVGKGNYTGGADDYFPAGYGETITGNLWDNGSDDSKAFLSSGKATVNVISGTVGYIDATNPEVSMKNQLPYGNVIGGSAGEAAPNIGEDPRYEYSPAFFSGYVNETDVTIGGYRCTTAYGDYQVGDFITAETFKSVAAGDAGKWEIVGPKIYASVYGGGQDGHVRRDTKVTVIGGEIGLPYNSTNQTLLQTDNLDSPQWMHRGNIYGGGSGITKYKYDFNYDGDTADNDGSVTYHSQPVKEEDYSSSSGSVTRFTEVNVMGGTIHRNVYGGGSMGSVGAPKIDQAYDPYKKNLNNTATLGKQSQNTINIGGGTSVVTIGTPTNYNKVYGGDVYGACRGQADLNENEFATSVWTQINIKDKAKIMGNVFGGGDSGIVKKDTDIQIGAE